MYSTQQCSHAVSCLVINLLNFIRNGRGEWGWKGARGKKKKNEERRRFVSLARPYHWFNSSLRGVRCAQPQPPAVHLLYHGVPFFFSFFCLLQHHRSIDLDLVPKRRRRRKKKTITNSQGREKERERASFVVVVTRAHASRDCDSRSITERARSVNKKSIRFTEVKVN